MAYDLRSLQTDYMPVLVSNIPFLIGPLYEERGGRQNRPSLCADVVGNPREDSHIKVKGMLVEKFKCGCEHQLDRGSVFASKNRLSTLQNSTQNDSISNRGTFCNFSLKTDAKMNKTSMKHL